MVFDDIFGVGFHGRTLHSVVFLGGEQFGASGAFPDHASLNAFSEQETVVLADINGDGFLDGITGDELANDTRGETYVVFGTETGIPDVRPRDLNGANGFVIAGARPGDRSGFSVGAGDVNADGFDDVVVGDGYSGGQGFEDSSHVQLQPFVHVVFGSPSPVTARIHVPTLDGTTGFRMETSRNDPDFDPPRRTSVASDIDVNGDGVDDILIGDTGGGADVEDGGGYFGALYVVFGRRQQSGTGVGPVNAALDIPFQGEVTYTVRAQVPDDYTGGLFGTTTVASSPEQVELDPRSSQVELLALPGDIDFDGVVGFSDFLIISANFGNMPATPELGDLNGDDVVDFNDFLILREDFGARLEG